MTTYISIDVATKSLAIGIYSMNLNLKTKSNINDHENISFIERMHKIDTLIVPLFVNVFDIAKGKNAKDTNIFDKAGSLKEVLTSIDSMMKSLLVESNIIVLVEYQMNANHLSNSIYNMIIYHYSNVYPIHIMMPAKKNKIYLHPILKLSTFLGYSSSNYKANKEHAKYNFLYFMILFNHEKMLIDIKKNNLDDIADTFMQMIAFHIL